MSLRDHEPIVIEQFGGLWARGDTESAPSDHFTQADNVQYFTSGVETRDALDQYKDLTPHSGRILRTYDYVMQSGQSLLILNDAGEIYHFIPPATLHGPVLTISGMSDFGFVAIAGRAYITPFNSVQNAQGANYELGLPNEFLYVYKGDGTSARKAAGAAPSNGGLLPFIAYVSAVNGRVTAGIHIIAVTFNNGIRTGEVHPVVIAPGDKQIDLVNIPLGPVGTTSRTIIMTKAIPDGAYNWDFNTFGYYFVHEILDNGTTAIKIDPPDENLITPYVPGLTPGPATGALMIWNNVVPGHCDFGFHLVGVVYETDTGYLTAPGPEHFAGQTYVETAKGIAVTNIPTSPSSAVVKRHLVSTKWIPEYNGDQNGYQFFFIPDGEINNNTATTKNVSYYDSDLVSDASHLIDNFSEIAAGVSLTTYHSRLVLVGDGSSSTGTTFRRRKSTRDVISLDNRSVARLSAPGEPESISKVDGLIIAPLDGNPLTNAQEFRDILYLYKKSRTYAYSDNRDEPSTWQEEIIDQGVGAPVHGVGTVLDAGGVNIDFLLIADWSGLMLFNGTYARPEMSWKIEDYWMSLVRNDFRFIQLVNDSISKRIWITLPPPNQNIVLHADYGEGLDAKNIAWAKWIFDGAVTTACLIETNKLILGVGDGIYKGIYYINPKKLIHKDNYFIAERKIPDPTVRTALFGE